MSVFKLALPGFNAKDARLDQEVLDSAYPSPKINTVPTPPHAGLIYLNWQSTIVVPLNSVKLLYSFPHGYNYIPTAFATYAYDDGTTRVNGVLLYSNNYGTLVLDTDSTNVNLKWISGDGTNPVPPFIMHIRYYVFAERGIS